MRRLATIALAIALTAGCGGSSNADATVFAASSLTNVFQSLDAGATFNFGASDALAFQIAQGAEADVFASASTKETNALRRQGIIEAPAVFAHNALALIVPADNPARIRSWRDLRRDDVGLVLAAPGVPAGDYAREALGHLGVATSSVVSEEPDVRGVLAKVALGGADAGIVYATDVAAGGNKVRALPIPKRVQPRIDYAIATVRDAPHAARAEEFVQLVLGNAGRAALERAGFSVP